MVIKFIGVILILIGIILFLNEYLKKSEQLNEEQKNLNLSDKQAEWGRKNTLYRSTALIIIGIFLLVAKF